MPDVTVSNARIVTLDGPDGLRRGQAMRDLGVIENGWVTITAGRIEQVGSGTPPDDMVGDALLDLDGRIVLPTWVDCHTHACWAGDRLDEFEQVLAGAAYTDILEGGGGILSTVRAVRDAPLEALVQMLARRMGRLQAFGTGTAEIKSGYGLTTESELKMLRAVHAVSQESDQQIAGTFLGAHAIDDEQPDFVDRVIEEMLPAVVEEFPGITCDAYLEQGAWSREQVRRLFERAVDLGCPIRLHTDQFNSLGGVDLAIEMGARSVDHLEAVSPEDVKRLADSDVPGVLLPACGLHLDRRWAPGRALIDAGAAIAIATNYNPGSAPTPSMPLTVALACRGCGLTPAEAICAATWNAACILGVSDDTGKLAPGYRADLQVFDERDERALAWEFGAVPPPIVLLGGTPVQFFAETEQDEADE